jgi:TPR repeat protein
MNSGFDRENYIEAHKYSKVVLKEVNLDRKYYIESHPNVLLNIKKAIEYKEKKALTLQEEIFKNELLKNGPPNAALLPHRFTPTSYKERDAHSDNPPVKKMEAALMSGNYEEAYEYGCLVLEEVELDKEYYIKNHPYVPPSIKSSIDLKEAQASTLLGDIYREGLIGNIPQNIDTAKKYYTTAFNLNYPEAEKRLDELKESEDYVGGRNTIPSHSS